MTTEASAEKGVDLSLQTDAADTASVDETTDNAEQETTSEASTVDKPVVQVEEVSKVDSIISPPTTGPLPGTRIHPLAQKSNIWRFNFINGTEKADLLRPAFWTHVAGNLRLGDTFNGMTDDGLMWFEGVVLNASGTSAVVHVTRADSVAKVAAPGMDSEFVADFGGQHELWRVVRKADRQVIRTGLATRDIANTWIRSHETSLKR